MLKKLRNNKKKGFTLVELIVVLVILAILAALLIPALTGYIDKARRKSVVAETRQVVMAAQSLIDEQYARNTAASLDTAVSVTEAGPTGISAQGKITLKIADITELSDTKGTIGATITVDTKGKITDLEYTNSSKKCEYKPANSANNTDGDYNVTAAGSQSNNQGQGTDNTQGGN